MITRGRHWPVRLATAAEDDYVEILRWTAQRFGDEQARVYANTLASALEELGAGPELVGVRERSDVAKGLFSLHVARHGRKARHFVMFRIGHDQRGETIDVLRILHDAMDLPRHVPPMEDSI